MAIRDEIKVQTEKIKDMDRKQKAEYIWTYYKLWFIGIAFALIVIISTVKGIVANRKPVYLEAVFLNSDLSGQTSEDVFANDFQEYVQANPKDYRMLFDYTVYLAKDLNDQVSYANQVKLISRYTAEEIDICVGPELVMLSSADVGGFKNLDTALPAELIKELEDKGYEPFYYTEKVYDDYPDPKGVTNYTLGETYLAGFYVDKCPKLIEEYGVYSAQSANTEENGRVVLTIATNAPNVDHAIEFIEYIINH